MYVSAYYPMNPAGTRHTALTMRVRADMSWPDTIGLVGGAGTLTFWAKLKHTPAADGGETLERVTCGVALPVVMTSPLLDGVRLLNEIPTASFDLPSRPHYTSHSSWRSGMLVSDTGWVLLGVTLDDPSAVWPEAYIAARLHLLLSAEQAGCRGRDPRRGRDRRSSQS